MMDFYIREMNLEKASNEFNAWRREVADRVEESEEYRALQDKDCNDVEYNEIHFSLVSKAVIQCLPKQYKRDNLKELTEENESIASLVENLQLEEYSEYI